MVEQARKWGSWEVGGNLWVTHWGGELTGGRWQFGKHMASLASVTCGRGSVANV